MENYQSYYETLRSRGPDDTRVLIYEPTEIYCFHRLAIQDLSSDGMQPFVLKHTDGFTYTLLCNGEIYNSKQLIKEFQLPVRSSSDCEVILHLYFHVQKDITQLASLLDGEFAFVFTRSDPKTGKIIGFAARDPFGVRPLFYAQNDDESSSSSSCLVFSSLLSGIAGLLDNAQQFPPGKIVTFDCHQGVYSWQSFYSTQIFDVPLPMYGIAPPSPYGLQFVHREICQRFILAVYKRLVGDRPLGALLSGGLDSSLVVAVAHKILGKELQTFSIGLDTEEMSTDLENAQLVVDHLKLPHHTTIKLNPQNALNSIEDVIKVCESYDITTIRASIMQYHLAKYIRENSEIKMILNGDGADELEMGYLYFHMAPDEDAAIKENLKLLSEIHFFDGLRVDRTLSHFGLEARLPFLDPSFVDYYLSIPTRYKIPGKGRMYPQEKQLIREAFHRCYPDLLPKEVLFRKKEAFSDGVSSTKNSWFVMLQNHISSLSSQSGSNNESSYYLSVFAQQFNKNGYCYDHVIPHYWMPNFSNAKDPSARVLEVYE